MSKGWISIHRELQDHWLWNDNRVFSKAEAWIDILLNVNHTDKKVMIKNTLFTVKRGQSINSQLTWSERWNWDRSKVRRFLDMLQNDKMIDLKTNNKTTILTVCKYDSYQDNRTSDEHQMNIKRTSDEHQTNTNNNDNNINKENNEINIDDEMDLNFLFNHYCNNDKIIQAMISNNKNKLKDKDALINRLKDFTDTIIQDGITKKTFVDYCKHFRLWNLKAPEKIEVNLSSKSNQIGSSKVTDKSNQY